MAERTPFLRSWLFAPGADLEGLLGAARTGADVVVQELEDFTPRALRGKARALAPQVVQAWKAAGIVSAVRVNPLDDEGAIDLRATMAAAPDIVMMSKVAEPKDVVALDALLTACEAEHGVAVGSTAIVPNIESAAGVVNTIAIAKASRRITAMLVATEDMVVDLGADRTRDGTELYYARARFLLECRAANVVAIDCPYTFQDAEGARRDMEVCRKIGFKAKAVVHPPHVAVTNETLTPSEEDVARAGRTVAVFDAARQEGRARAEVDGLLVEVPSYLSAKRLLERHATLRAFRRIG